MGRIAHLSDLHFGREQAALIEPLATAVNALDVDLVAVSGDLTQRARTSQFQAARRFLDKLVAPVMVVPGNHDVPLHNVAGRWLRPWQRYRRWITDDLSPVHRASDMVVAGLNSVDPFAWQRGRIGTRMVRHACRAFRGLGDECARVVVLHHPLEHLPGERKTRPVGADAAIDGLAACGTQIVLAGHLHSWRAAPFARLDGGHGMLQVQAGTGLSDRLRGEENDFNLLDVSARSVTISRHVWDLDRPEFRKISEAQFALGRGTTRNSA